VALLTAGELAAFLAGLRGVCLLQLHKGWGDRSAAVQALLRPWVLALLQAAATHKGVVLLRSAAPQELGASLVLCARQQPFHAWGKHLASQGVQAAIVADSPFYKLLIGGWVLV
jgi:ABC-type Co2+ transport system permease subunit